MRRAIPADDLLLPACRAWRRDCFLLAAGDFPSGQYNCMTVGWGGIGALWDRPVALVAVKPGRHTFGFLERFPTFTLSRFPESYRRTLLYLGTHSGRDEDKIRESGLTPIASAVAAAPGFAEAELILECSQVYADDYHPELALAETMRIGARSGRHHRLFFGEILAIFGEARYTVESAGPRGE